MGWMTMTHTKLEVDGYRGELNDRCVTLAETLRPAGYSTYAVGKWHVTDYVDATPEHKFNWPLQRGFDHYFGIISGLANYYHPDSLTRDNDRLPIPKEGFYTTDAFVDNAIDFFNNRPKDKPFFLYLAFNAPHFPLMAPQEEIAKFREQYKAGWDKLREQRYEKMVEMGIIDKSWALSPLPNQIKPWASLNDKERKHFEQIMPIYAACVNHMDAAVGRLVAALKQDGTLDNTLILFLSDNGANAEGGPNGKLEGEVPGSGESNVYEGQSWATLSNTPLRRYKHFDHEGGISTPLIAYWPSRIKSAGELRTHPGHIVDIMATCVDLAGAKYPTAFKGKPILPMEGRSLVPAFDNKPIERDEICWEHEGNAAIRIGDWKLVRYHTGGLWHNIQTWELYNLKTDRTELHDLAAAQPERVKEMATKWQAWARRTQVEPYPNVPPNFSW